MISSRLKAIASLVDTKSIIDVGCDHALLDVYLTQKGIKCRGTDISSNCIKLAKETIKKENLEDKIELYVTDGLKDINILDTDTIVIAGMGTNTILDIIKDVESPLILLSNNDVFKLRKEVVKKGYYIDDEVAIKDGKYYYVIIRFKKGYRKYKYSDYILGPILKNKKTEYYDYLYNKLLRNYNNISNKNIFKKLKERKILKIVKNKKVL